MVSQGSKELTTAAEIKTGLTLAVAQGYVNGGIGFGEIAAPTPDASTTISAPSLDSKTETTVNTAP